MSTTPCYRSTNATNTLVRLLLVVIIALGAQLGVQLVQSQVASAQETPDVPDITVRKDGDTYRFSWSAQGAARYQIATPGPAGCDTLAVDGGVTQEAGLTCNPLTETSEICVAAQSISPTFDRSAFSAFTCVGADADPFNLGTSYVGSDFAIGPIQLGEAIPQASNRECLADFAVTPVRYLCVDEAQRADTITGIQASGANDGRLFWIGAGLARPVIDYEFTTLRPNFALGGVLKSPATFENGETVDVGFKFNNYNASDDTAFDAGFEVFVPSGVVLLSAPPTCSYLSPRLVCYVGDVAPNESVTVNVSVRVLENATYESLRLRLRMLETDTSKAHFVRYSSDFLRPADRRDTNFPCGLCTHPDRDRKREATTFSHPNLVTFDGRRYIFHGAGDYVLAEAVNDEFAVHVRFSRMDSTTVSFNQAIAAQVGDTIVSFGDDDESGAFATAVVRIDGIAIEVGTNFVPIEDKATIGLADGQYELRWNDGTVLRVGTRVADPWALEISEARWGQVRGLLGDADGDEMNDLESRDDTPFDYNSMELSDIFGASWLLDETTTLFASDLRAIDRLPIVPSAVITLADLPPADVAEAEQLCTDAGVVAGAGLSECAFDVALTGDLRWISGLELVSGIIAESVSVLAERGLIEDDVQLDGAAVVNGSIGGVGATDVYRLQLEEGASITVTVGDQCTNPSTFEFALESPSGQFVGRSSGSFCGRMGVFDLPETGEYALRIYDTNGYSGDYSVTIALPTSTINELQLNTMVTGTLDDGDETFYILEIEEDDTLAYVDGSDGQLCGGLRWQIVDPFGGLIGDQPCYRSGSITLDAGTWVVRVYSKQWRRWRGLRHCPMDANARRSY